MPDRLAPLERLALVRTLNSLPGPVFEEVCVAVGVPSNVLPAVSAAQGLRSTALLGWAESPVGCGVDVLKEIVEQIVAYQQETSQGQAPLPSPSVSSGVQQMSSSSPDSGPSGYLALSKEDRTQLRKAIQKAYPELGDLEILVDEELNRNLAVIVNIHQAYGKVVFALIKWAIAKGYIGDLVLALSQDTNNPDLIRICRQVLNQRLDVNPALPTSTEAVLPLEPSDWGIDIQSEDLQFFLPERSTLEADVGTLSRGLLLSNAVCKITFSDRSSKACGTGVLIAPGLVLTNYHVLSHQANADLNAIAQSAQFEFGYVSTTQDDVNRTRQLRVLGDQPVLSSSPKEELDYVLLRVGYGEDVVITPVRYDVTSSLEPRSPLNILQHPEGEQMKVSLSNNGVVKTNMDKGLVLYVNETKRGSSGSPCFDAEWKLVALHHKEMQTSFGSVREGILFSAIYPRIASFL